MVMCFIAIYFNITEVLLFHFYKDAEISSDHHALIVPPFMGHGNRVHPMPFPDSSPPSKSSFLSMSACLFPH